MAINIPVYNASQSIDAKNSALPQPAHCNSQSPSDWAILNSADTKRLCRLLKADNLAAPSIEYACRLISTYHAVYRRALVQMRREGYYGQCPPPTAQQLEQMVITLAEEHSFKYSSTHVLADLKTLAWKLLIMSSLQKQ